MLEHLQNDTITKIRNRKLETIQTTAEFINIHNKFFKLIKQSKVMR
jgi:hypothetical protein